MAAWFWAACAILSDSIPCVSSICCCSLAKKLTCQDATNFDGPPKWNVPPPRRASRWRQQVSDHSHFTLRLGRNCIFYFLNRDIRQP